MDIETRRRLALELPLDRLVELLEGEPWLEGTIVEALSMADAGKALALVQQTGIMPTQVCHDIISGFVEQHGFDRAAQVALGLPVRNARLQASDRQVELWSKEDPAAALAWINAIPDSALRFASLRLWAPEAARNDPDQAMALATDVDSVSTRASVTFYGALELASSDPTRAFARLGEFTRSDWNSLMTASRLTAEVAKQSPAQALQLLEEFALQQGYSQSTTYAATRLNAYEKTLEIWAIRDREAAQAYAEALTDPAVRAAALEGVAKTVQANP
jgi:hypothetical protein